MHPIPFLLSVLTAVVCTGATVPVSSMPDEGMWPFDSLPLQRLKEKYGFEPTKEWLDHVRLGSVRFDTGGSGSFVSPNGLVMTNHHVALTTLQQVSTQEKDWVKDSFSAREYGSELPAHSEAEGKKKLTLRQLTGIRDVTKEVKEAEAKGEARKAKLEELCAAITRPEEKIEAEAITLFDGQEFRIYVYHMFDDVRVVFAPEKQVAFFGGDADNFTYPRYDLDCAFFRVYEKGKPVDSSKWYFKWNEQGAKTDELVFVSGHPGGTERLLTHEEMEFDRDVFAPAVVKHMTRARDFLKAQMARGEKQAFEHRDSYFQVANTLKAFEGHLAGLRDAPMLAKIKARDQELLTRSGKPEVKEAFDFIAEEMTKLRKAGARMDVATLDARRKQVIEEVCGKAKQTINRARFEVHGTAMYPDATFSLRLAYGTVKGYEAGTTMVPVKTTFNGLFERNAAFDNTHPFDLPKRWLDAKAKLDLNTPLNFICTCDIIGGNSGSPVLNRNAEVVGLVFDGNIESLPGNYWFDETVNRCVSVHTGGMLEAIEKVYGEKELAKELRGK